MRLSIAQVLHVPNELFQLGVLDCTTVVHVVPVFPYCPVYTVLSVCVTCVILIIILLFWYLFILSVILCTYCTAQGLLVNDLTYLHFPKFLSSFRHTVVPCAVSTECTIFFLFLLQVFCFFSFFWLHFF